MGLTQTRFETNHHPVPPAVAAAMGRKGRREVAGAPLPERTPQQSLEIIAAGAIQTAILSLTAPVFSSNEVLQARDLARAITQVPLHEALGGDAQAAQGQSAT